MIRLLQRRGIFIKIKETPNEHCKTFSVGEQDRFMTEDKDTKEYIGANTAYDSPLAMFLFQISGVRQVMIGQHFVAVTKEKSEKWGSMGPAVCEAITAFGQTGNEAVCSSAEESPYADTAPQPDDSEELQAIKELIAGEVRSMVHKDGGDIRLVGFDSDSGSVLVTLQGACSTCSSSSQTLTGSVQRTLKHWLPEVTQVVRVTSAFEQLYKSSGCLTATGYSIEELLEETEQAFQSEAGGTLDDEDLAYQIKGDGRGACST